MAERKRERATEIRVGGACGGAHAFVTSPLSSSRTHSSDVDPRVQGQRCEVTSGAKPVSKCDETTATSGDGLYGMAAAAAPMSTASKSALSLKPHPFCGGEEGEEREGRV